jgi:hypothetical protein
MQFAKDSFYMALRERLAALDPSRTVTLNGAMRPAVIVAENELVIPIEPVPDAFYLEWGAVRVAAGEWGNHALIQMECLISYHTLGTCESGVDRGRALSALDMELMSICLPHRTSKRDYAQSPSVDLGTNVVWTAPDLGEVSGSEGPGGRTRGSQRVRLERKARLQVFFFTEGSVQ